MKKILIIGAGDIQVPVIKKAKEMGLFVISTDFNPEAPGFKYSDIGEVVSTIDFEGNFEIAKKYEVDGVLTTSDLPVNTVAYICDKLKLPGLNIESAKLATNKYLLREILKENKLKTPNFEVVYSKEELKTVVNKLKFPLVMKPIDSSASRGVIKVFSENELFKEFDESMKYSNSKGIILEEFINGNEYSVECLIQDGNINIIAITEKTVTGEPYFVEVRHIVPAKLDSEDIDNINELINRIVKLVGLNNSAAHIELKLSSEGPTIIELGARLGGDFITSDLVPLATGIDMLGNIINISINQKININKYINKNAAIQFLYDGNFDKFISNKDRILNNDDIIRFEITKEKGIKLKSSLDRSGYIIFTNDNREQIIEHLDFRGENE